MAITTTTIGINTDNAGTWTSTEVIDQFEQAFSWLEWHGDSQSGLCVGLSTYSGGGTVGLVDDDYQNVHAVETTGIGTGASFWVDRNDGVVRTIYVNNPGYGYTGGEVLTLSSEDIGGSVNGATDLTLTTVVNGTIANGIGYTVTFNFEYNANGTDRNGAVSGQAATITIKEGDTLKLVNEQSSSSYQINIIWNGTSNTAAGDTNRVFNVNGQQNSNTASGETTWTPLPGQAGTYFVRDDSTFYSYSKIVVQPADSGDITLTSVGSTTTFHDKGPSGANDFGVFRHTIQSGKKFGTTFRSIHMVHNDVTNLWITQGSGYFPFSLSFSRFYGGGHATDHRFSGAQFLDLGYYSIFDFDSRQQDSDFYQNSQNYAGSNYYLKTGGNTQYQLDLNIYRSSLDPNFAVLSFRSPTLPSTHISGNTFGTFIFHNFTTDIWDLDNLFLGGLTQISGNGNGGTTFPYLKMTSYLSGSKYPSFTESTYSQAKRTAEWGYVPQNTDDSDGSFVRTTSVALQYYYSLAYPQSTLLAGSRIYYRNSDNAIRTKGGSNNERTGNDSISSDADFNAVIKGIPLNGNFIPSPYYLPDDFVMIDFDFGTPNSNIQQGDTVTISGSEVYTVIQGSYNNTNASRTRGILFCARTV